jgi:putative ABC transport system permease protein
MKLIEIFYSSFSALLQNRKRSILTMFGIVVGISSVITIMSLGRGFERYTVKNLTKTAESTIQVTLNFEPFDYQLYDDPTASFFNAADLLQIQRMEGIKKADAEVVEETSLYITTNFLGTNYKQTVSLSEEGGAETIVGREITKVDGLHYAKVCTVSEQTAKLLSSDSSKILGYGIEVDGQLYTTVGVYKDATEFSLFSDSDIEIPKASYEYYRRKNGQIQSINLTIDSAYKPSKVVNQVIKQMTMNGSMSSFGEYSSFGLSELTDGIGKVLQMLTYFISAIAGISLFIAGVGVMNMMYISVSERVREIGICRAMGAKKRDICFQFLFEGLFLTLFAGIIGYLIGLLIAVFVSFFLPFSVYPDIYTCTLAIGISLTIGLVFSIVPAVNAANKDLIEILK